MGRVLQKRWREGYAENREASAVGEGFLCTGKIALGAQMFLR
jgi:hypothetical protein